MSEDNKNQGAAVGLGSSASAAFALFGYGGYYLDQKYQTEPVWLLVGMLMAFVWIFYEVWKIISRNGK